MARKQKKISKTTVGGASKNKKIRNRVDPEGQYDGSWRLQVLWAPESSQPKPWTMLSY